MDMVTAAIDEHDRKWTDLLMAFETQSCAWQSQSHPQHCKMLKQLFNTKLEAAMSTLDGKLTMTLDTALTLVWSQVKTLET